MKKLGFAAWSVMGLLGCGAREPAVAAPPASRPAATVAPVPAPIQVKAEAKPLPPTGPQVTAAFHDRWAAFNAKDFTQFQAMWADGATSETLDMGPPLVGAAIIEQGVKPFTSAFPDISGEVELALINGNDVMGIVLMRGTQTGTYVTPMGPVPATNKRVGFLAANSVHFNDEPKIVKDILAYDGGTVAGQLGLMPMPHRKVIVAGWAEKPVVIANGSDLEKANLAAVTQEVAAFNRHDAAGALSTAADDIVFAEMSAPADRTGRKEAIKGLEDLFKAFPDVKLELKTIWGAGDYVVLTGTWSGTNTGDLPAMHLKKTGKSLSLAYVEIDKLVAGKTKNIWLFSNGAAAAAQLGMIPPPRPVKATPATR